MGLAAALVAAALVAGLLLSERSTLPEQARDSASSVPVAERDPLPEFTGRLADGTRFSDEDVKVPAVIHFYASWCEICRSEAPAFAQLQREHRDLNYYLVAVEDTPSDAAAFARQFGWQPAPLLDDPRRQVEASFSLVGQPHTVFVTAERTVVVHQGGASYGDLDALARDVS